MNWTVVPPKIDGYYWYREIRPNGSQTKRCLKHFYVNAIPKILSHNIPQWAGPIPLPVEVYE